MSQFHKYTRLIADSARAHDDEWNERVRACGRRLISAISFREVAHSTYKNTDTVLLAVIGHYYSMFHLGIALLYFDPHTKPSELRQLKHSVLRRLLQERLVNKQMIPRKFLRILKELLKLRETANYAFGGKHIADRTDFKSIVPGLYRRTRSSFEKSIFHLNMLGMSVDEGLKREHALAAWIGDGIGNDAFVNYLSAADRATVEKYLLDHELVL